MSVRRVRVRVRENKRGMREIQGRESEGARERGGIWAVGRDMMMIRTKVLR